MQNATLSNSKILAYEQGHKKEVLHKDVVPAPLLMLQQQKLSILFEPNGYIR